MNQIKQENDIKNTIDKLKNYPKDKNLSTNVWRCLFLVSVVIHYFLTTFSYVFLKDHINRTVYWLILSLDAVYIIDYIVAVANFCWTKKRAPQLKQPMRSNLVLFFDFWLILPYSYVYEFFPDFNYTTFLYLRSVSVLRLFHLMLFFREKWHTVGINHIKCFTFQYLIYFIIRIHAATCLWNYSAFSDSDGWTNVEDLRDKYRSVFGRYTICFYFSLMDITNRNFGDLFPLGAMHKILPSMIMSVGFTITTVIFIASLSFLLDNAYRRRTNFKVQLEIISKFLNLISASRVTFERIQSYYQVLWDKKKGVHQATQFASLPYPLKCEICFDVNISFFQTSLLFRDKSDAFLRVVSNLMKHEFYQTGEFIYHRNVAKNKTIFVVIGTLEILSDEDDESPVVTLTSGSCLGETALILSIPARCSVRAASYTEIQVLYRKHFYTILDLFPEIYENIHDTVLKRVEDAQIAKLGEKENINLNPFFSQSQIVSIKSLKNKLREPNFKADDKNRYLALYKLKNNPTMTKNFPWILDPESSVRKTWEYLIVIIALYMNFTYPYFIVFLKSFSFWFDFVATFIDFILVLDVYVILTTAIEEKNRKINTFIEITRKRVTQIGFYLDFISCIKIELFYWIWTTNKRYIDVLRFNRLLKIYRIPKLIRKYENRIDLNLHGLTAIKYIFYLVMITYWYGVFLYLTTCFEDLCTEDGWFLTKITTDFEQQLEVTYTNYELLTSIYFSLSCLTGFTAGDISPVNIIDRIIICFGFIIGLFTFCCCVSQLAAALTRRLKIFLDFQESLYLVVNFTKEKRMDKVLIQRIKRYFEVQWNYNKASILREQNLLHNTNTEIQIQIQIDEKMDALTSVPLFQGLNRDFLIFLVKESRTLVLPPDEFITYKEGILKILYIIIDGRCIRQFENSSVLIGPKSYFGSLCFFSNVNSLCSVETVTHVKVLCITEEIFWKGASLYCDTFKRYKNTSQSFDLLEEFKKIPIDVILEKKMDVEDDPSLSKGSFVNVIAYCRKRGENYGAPFQELGILFWLKMVMLPICILPFGKFLKMWVVMRLFVALIVTILIPYQLIQSPYTPKVDIILFIADIIAYVDLYVKLFVGYYGSKNQLILHPLKTAVHYLKGKFLLDFIFCFPWEILLKYISKSKKTMPPVNLLDNLKCVIKIIRMGQIYRLFQFFNFMTYFGKRNYGNIFQILKCIAATFIFVHFWATVLVSNSCKYFPVSSKNFSLNFTCNKDSWIDRSKFRNFTNPLEVYTTSIYFCASVLSFCGLGDITPKYPSTVIITTVMFSCGILFIGYVYAKIASYKTHWYNNLFKNQELITELKRFMKQENLPQTLQRQVTERLEYRWKHNQTLEVNKTLNKVHPALYEDLIYAMFENIFKTVPIFVNVDKAFLRVFGKIVKERCYLRQEIIYRIDDIVSEICIVKKGAVLIFHKDGNLAAELEEGGIFGNITRKGRHKITINVTAKTNVDVLYVDNELFYSTLQKYPWITNTIETNLTRNTDFMLPASGEVSGKTKSAVKAVTSSNTFVPITDETKSSVAEFFLLCLPWKLFRTAVPENATLLKYFAIYCLVLTHLSSLFILYEFAFQDHSSYLLGLAVYEDITFIFKILVDMHKSYQNSYGEQVTSNKKILRRYFRKKILKRSIDFVVNFPFYYFTFFFRCFYTFNTLLYFSCLRMLTLYRLTYFWDYYSVKYNQLAVNISVLKICGMIVSGTLVIHIFTCGWYLCACPLTTCFEDSWIIEVFNTTAPQNTNKMDIYITSLYFVITIMTTTGTGDIVAYNVREQIYISLMMLSSIFLTGIFIGEIWNFLVSTTVTRVNYDHEIDKLKHYFKNSNVSDYQMKKMWRYVQRIWSVSRGNQVPQAMSLLHTATLQELMTPVYGPLITNSHIFSDVEESFSRQLCQYLKRLIFFPGNYIVQHGDFDNTMYFIHYGEVDILTVHPNLTETVHEVLHSGDMFGVLQGLYHDVSHHFFFRARTTVHLVALHFDDWKHLLEFFPESRNSIYAKTERVQV